MQAVSDQRRGRDSSEVYLAENADELIELWLADLPRGRGKTGWSGDLLGAYRTLAHAVIHHALRPEWADDDTGVEAGDDPDLDRALAGISAAARRSGLTASDMLDDLSRLTQILRSWLMSHTGEAEETVDVLRGTLGIVHTLKVVGRRIVRILEASAIRAQREQSETLAAMTDQLSHELRNRLGAARTASDMLLDPGIKLDEQGLIHVAQLIRSSIEAALRTVGDVRALVASRSNLEGSPLRSVSLPKLVRGVVEELTPHALDAGVDLSVEGDVPECQVDAARLRLIVFNLIGNGIKYRDHTASEPVVKVECERRAGGMVELKTTDNGIGIPADDIEDIFLYRARGSETEDVAGSGLGLAIVREAVDQIGGEISIESEVGSGTVFTLVFKPLSWPEAPA